MKQIPDSVRQAWNEREGAVVLATVDHAGIPNAIYATCVRMLDDGRIVIADNYFRKTRENISGGGNASVLFMTKAGKSYQAKGRVTRQTQGPVFDAMKQWLDPKFPGLVAAVLEPESVYSGAEKLL